MGFEVHATEEAGGRGGHGRSWPRAVALFAVVLSMSVVRPGVLVAIPLIALLALRGARGGAVFALFALSLLVALGGVRDGVWYVERAWALLLAGWFVAVTLAAPGWRLSSRAMAAVAGAAGVGALFMLLRSGAWSALDWTVSDAVMASVTATMDALTVLREGRPLSPAFVGAMYEMAEAQAAVFPAMVAIASMAALGVAWWIATRLAGPREEGLGPLSGFRFNDHLVWIMIGGLTLFVSRSGEALSRVGANVVVFMGALYALRGAAVVAFSTRGPSALGILALAIATFLAAPVVIGGAILIGIGDTWLDLRGRVGEPAP